MIPQELQQQVFHTPALRLCKLVFVAGEEYLHHVIYERKKHAKWLTVDVDTSKFKNNEQSIQIHMVFFIVYLRNFITEFYIVE